jgi:nucleotide-binding universal stress UspA family protein
MMTDTPFTIVVGANSCRTTDPVLPYALQLAQTIGAELHVVHAYSYAEPIDEAYERLGIPRLAVDEHYRAFARQQLEQEVAACGSYDRVRCHAVEGAPAGVISDLAADVNAGLIIVGAPSHGRIARAVLGTLAEQVTRGAPAPVLVMRSPLPAGQARVLIATDLSEMADPVCLQALSLGRVLFGGAMPDVRILMAISPRAVVPGRAVNEIFEQIATHELRRFLAGLPESGRGVQPVVRIGDAAAEILREAADWEAELVVTGTHGRHGLKRLVLGSVAAEVLIRSTGNVLVVPPGARATANRFPAYAAGAPAADAAARDGRNR